MNHIRWGIAFFLAAAIGSCAPLIGVGVTGAVVGTAAATRGCYDHYFVTVYDGRTENRTCAASVVAQNAEGKTVPFTSCYYGELDEGAWTIIASQDGFIRDSSTAVVRHGDSCVNNPWTVELTLNPAYPAPVPSTPYSPPYGPSVVASPGVPSGAAPSASPATSATGVSGPAAGAGKPAPSAQPPQAQPERQAPPAKSSSGWFPPAESTDAGSH